MSKAKIVVSYRRSDARAMAGRIRDKLAARFGERSVYFDIDNIPFGVDFRKHIDSALRDADVLVAIVGPGWRGDDAEGQPRIFQDTDPVRVEIETALAHGIAIVPILLEGAAMPHASALPDSIKDFSFVNAAEVDEGRDFHQHMERVERAIETVLRRTKPRFRPGLVKRTVAAAAVAIVVGTVGWMLAPQLSDGFRRLVPAAISAKTPVGDTAERPEAVIPASLRRTALVIGNSNYRHVAKLTTPINDANAMAQQFKSAGFDTVLRLDAGNSDFRRELREFSQTAAAADIGVVYFSGYGMAIGDANYLIPVDATLANDYDAVDEAINLDRLVLSVDSVKRLRLLILDASRDNPFDATMKRSRTNRPGLERAEPSSADGLLIAYSAKAGSISIDGDGPNSIYVASLLKHLFAPGLDVRFALGRIRQDVMEATVGRQEPFVYGTIASSVVLVAKN